MSIAIVICDEYTWFSGGRDGRTKEVDDDGVLNVGKKSRERKIPVLSKHHLIIKIHSHVGCAERRSH